MHPILGLKAWESLVLSTCGKIGLVLVVAVVQVVCAMCQRATTWCYSLYIMHFKLEINAKTYIYICYKYNFLPSDRFNGLLGLFCIFQI